VTSDPAQVKISANAPRQLQLDALKAQGQPGDRNQAESTPSTQRSALDATRRAESVRGMG
jgi:hypothetical protein